MISYDLQCSNNHAFEGWFEDSKAYEDQKKKELIACPVCNDTLVSRIPSTFAIKTSHNQSGKDFSATQVDPANISKKIGEFVKNNFDDVGCDFTKEALKIHYGAVEPRNIRGVSTKQEEELLQDEGVRFLKIPMPTTPDTDA